VVCFLNVLSMQDRKAAPPQVVQQARAADAANPDARHGVRAAGRSPCWKARRAALRAAQRAAARHRTLRGEHQLKPLITYFFLLPL
jgi:hypothetical protein